jgi:molybdopterin molybdotransferase
MLEALVERDGGVAETASRVADLPQALAVPGADLVLVCGGTGLGESDVAASALAQTGRLELLGVAIRPGETACLGAVGAVPVFLLPGLPVACYAAYELLAGPSVRRMGGRNADWPYGRAELPLRRKLVSEIGVADLQRVRVVDGGIEPVGAGTAFGLASVVRADGFVVVSPGSEGYPAGTRVEVRLYEPLVTA